MLVLLTSCGERSALKPIKFSNIPSSRLFQLPRVLKVDRMRTQDVEYTLSVRFFCLV